MSRPSRLAERRGFTLVEVVVASLIGLVLIAIAWRVFLSDRSRFELDQGRLAGLNGALLFQQSLEADLASLATYLPEPGHPRFHVNNPFEFGASNRSVKFLVARPRDDELGLTAAAVVSYGLDAATSRLVREEGSDRRMYRSARVEDLMFMLMYMKSDPGGLGLIAAPFTFHQDRKLPFLKYRIVCTSEQPRQPGAGPGRERIILAGATALPYRQDRAYHPYWPCAGFELPGPTR